MLSYTKKKTLVVYNWKTYFKSVIDVSEDVFAAANINSSVAMLLSLSHGPLNGVESRSRSWPNDHKMYHEMLGNGGHNYLT